MSILAMKRLNVIALTTDRDELLKGLMKLGCVEISEPDVSLNSEQSELILETDDSRAQRVSASLHEIEGALSVIDSYSPISRGLFSAPRTISAEKLFDEKQVEDALKISQSIDALVRNISTYESELSRLSSRKASLMPWLSTDVPLDITSTQSLDVTFAVCPSSVAVEDIDEAAASITDAYMLETVHSDSEQHYFILLSYAEDSEELITHIKRVGVNTISFKEYSGTPAYNIDKIEMRERELTELIAQSKAEIVSYKESSKLLENAIDSLSAKLVRENARENLLKTEQTVILNGWIPEREVKRTTALLSKFDCAFELSDPVEGDSPPVYLYNSKLIYPFNMVTNLYSLPAYGSLDPNPLYALFFTLFFGIMFADIGYGLILIAISIFGMKKLHLRKGSTMQQLFMLMSHCGAGAIFWGIMFGSFFGDSVTVFSQNFLKNTYSLPVIAFNPLEGDGPLILLVLCLAMGAAHIIFGMGIKAYMLIRDGKPWDAIMDVGSWWLLFAGIAVGALGKGWYVALAGALALVLTQGRSAKGIFRKLTGGLGSLYDIASYFSDILSYSRLMALCMASAVIAGVFNMLGGMTGPFFFWIVFILGHLFNMAVNIIGTFVHDARLQYLEFFGKWFVEGGRPFEPLGVLTKYVEIENEQEEISLWRA